MRTSLAPTRKTPTPLPDQPEVTLAVVTYCPPDAYYKGRADVFKMSMDTMLAGAKGHKTELIIWNNGSDSIYEDLILSYTPTVYIRSANIGGYHARGRMCDLARGPLVSIADDDVLYSCDWLDKQLEVWRAFPGIASVSGDPRRFKDGFRLHPSIPFQRYGKLIPEPWMRDFNRAIGEPTHTQPEGWDIWTERDGVKAWIVRCDIQLMGEPAKLASYHREPCGYVGASGELTKRMMLAGEVQLSTFARTAVHIGNRIDADVMRIYKLFQKPSIEPVIAKGKLL